jgi:hypothetical protein
LPKVLSALIFYLWGIWLLKKVFEHSPVRFHEV